jgi:formylglycine-generating enzyme required for sulfatase activity
VQDLERLGELLGHLTGDMAKVCSKAETLIEEDLPEKVEGAVLRALRDDPVLMAAKQKMEQVCQQMSRIEEQNRKLNEGMEEIRPTVGLIARGMGELTLKRFNVGDVLDGFELKARLGSGSWGQVFWATRSYDGQKKALKIMHPELAQKRDVLDGFKSEIDTLKNKLPFHPNLVQIDKAVHCATQDCWYIVMECVEGPTLDQHLADKGALSANEVIKLFQPVIEALGLAHANGIVHRDIKPGNIVFRKPDELVLIDFGLANGNNEFGKARVDGKTIFFAAPEQLRGRSADSRSDVFSLAATMHFALEYADRDRREPDHFSAANAPAELRDAMVRSMANNPAERFADASKLASAFKAPLVPAKTRTIDLGAGVNLELVLIPAGTFMMGSSDSEAERNTLETHHEVTISKPFYMGKYPITLAQWQRFVSATSYKSEAETSGGAYIYDGEWKLNPNINWKTPGFKQEANHPMVCVSWNDVQQFHGWLNSFGLKDASIFQSPSEAQWEYACRAGTTTPYHFGNQLNGTQANCDGNYPYGTDKKGPNLEKTTPVGKYPANAWGLHDMHGNVNEWCADWYGDYPSGSVTDPNGPATGSKRVFRGGCWGSVAVDCRSAYRYGYDPSIRSFILGFRVALSSSGIPK